MYDPKILDIKPEDLQERFLVVSTFEQHESFKKVSNVIYMYLELILLLAGTLC